MRLRLLLVSTVLVATTSFAEQAAVNFHLDPMVGFSNPDSGLDLTVGPHDSYLGVMAGSLTHESGPDATVGPLTHDSDFGPTVASSEPHSGLTSMH